MGGGVLELIFFFEKDRSSEVQIRSKESFRIWEREKRINGERKRKNKHM